MTTARAYSRLLCLLIVVVLISCTSTKLRTVWTRADYSGEPVRYLMIAAVTDKEHNRQLYEDSFVKMLQRYGIKAVASHGLIKDLKASHERNEIQAIVQQLGVDGVLVATLESVDIEAKVTSSTADYRPLLGGEETYSQYWGKTISQSGYAVTETTVKLKTSLFTTQTEKMIWQGRTQSFNPSSKQTLIDENTRVIIEHLKQTGLL